MRSNGSTAVVPDTMIIVRTRAPGDRNLPSVARRLLPQARHAEIRDYGAATEVNGLHSVPSSRLSIWARLSKLVDRIQQLVPSFDGGDDLVWVLGPGKGLGALVRLAEEAVDGGFEFFVGPEDAALETLLGKFGQESLDGIEPGGRGRGEVEDDAGMAFEPFHDLGVPVSGIIVDNGVDRLVLRNVGLDGVQEADELLMPVSLHAPPDDLAFENVEGGKQCGRAVAFIVVGHRPGAPSLQRQSGLCPIEGLYLALLVDRQNDGVVGRVDIEANDVSPLGGERLVFGQPELAHPMGLQTMAAPNTLNRTDGDPARFGHRRARPTGRLGRRPCKGQGNYAISNLRRQRRNPRGPSFVAPQPGDAFGAHPLLPMSNDGFRVARPAFDLSRPLPLNRQKDDLRSPDMLLRAVPVRHHRLQGGPVLPAQLERSPVVHPPDSHTQVSRGIHRGIEPSDFIH